MSACPQCGKGISFWRRSLVSGLCAECQAEADRRQAEADRLAEAEALLRQKAETQRALVAQERRGAARSKCPCCGSNRYRTGCLPDSGGSALTGSNRARFRPEENWVEAHELVALACLDCGHVRLFLQEGDRAYLSQENP